MNPTARPSASRCTRAGSASRVRSKSRSGTKGRGEGTAQGLTPRVRAVEATLSSAAFPLEGGAGHGVRNRRQQGAVDHARRRIFCRFREPESDVTQREGTGGDGKMGNEGATRRDRPSSRRVSLRDTHAGRRQPVAPVGKRSRATAAVELHRPSAGPPVAGAPWADEPWMARTQRGDLRARLRYLARSGPKSRHTPSALSVLE